MHQELWLGQFALDGDPALEDRVIGADRTRAIFGCSSFGELRVRQRIVADDEGSSVPIGGVFL